MWIFVIGIIVLVGAAYFGTQRNKRLIEEGKMLDRDGTFYEKKELFITTSGYDAVMDALKNADYSDAGASVYQSEDNSLLFKSSHSWNARLTYNGEQDGKNVFCYSLINWKTHNGLPWRIDTMNMMLTSVEKAFLSLDPNTMVETHKMETKTKTSFF